MHSVAPLAAAASAEGRLQNEVCASGPRSFVQAIHLIDLEGGRSEVIPRTGSEFGHIQNCTPVSI
jgi:hypothetical protein